MNKYGGREVVVTGLGPVSPIGVGRENYWDALKNGKSGIKKISLFDTSGLDCRIGGEIDPKLTADIRAEIGKPVSRGTSFVIKAARLALEDAGVEEADFAASSSGIYVGISTNDMGVVESEYSLFKDYGYVNSTVVSSSFPHAAASEVAGALKCSGEVITVSTGCSSGLLSIISGVESILRGETEMVLAGGGDAPLTPFVMACFASAGFISTLYNDNPTSASRPFDAKRDKGVLSEGAGMLLLESAARAKSRNARVYGKIVGWGVSNAASAVNLKSSFISSITQAFQKTNYSLFNIDYICAHAPGEKYVDRAEVKAIKEFFGSNAYNFPVSSIKSMIGNPLAASGPLQIIAALQALQEKYVPPTINYEFYDRKCDLDFVPNETRISRIYRALVNVKSIGGTNSSLILSVI